ncbi:MAG TPA: saccharopine dehydrogenase C-terminal domain-containing protein [Candidatus Nanoarchaeia archaeon]|nr:saccharopine dehydrogenase C-terminal domain-containing protein [Candidatus Nanoarchaeia archaeon]
MVYDFVVLGSTGMQGRIVSKDLLGKGYSVLLCGRDKQRVDPLLKKYPRARFEYLDMSDRKNASNVVGRSGANVVVNCVEGDWNLESLKICSALGVHSIDLGSDMKMTKDQLAMSDTLKRKGIIHITGCGSVPGIGNVMLRHAVQKLDNVRDVDVGFAWGSNMEEFVVPFSIQSIIEEFITPAPYINRGRFVTINPMESIEIKHHRAIGKQRQFTIGHHPETYTFYNYCKKKGVKNVRFFAGFPDHSFDNIKMMIDLGLGNTEEIEFQGMKIKPVEFLREVLKNLEVPEGYTEKENLWVELRGSDKTILMECIVPTLKGWEDAGCNVDTGLPASIIAQMIKNKVIQESGSYAPEEVVPVELFFKELRSRNMDVYENGKIIN